jgi:prepilin-type N-terminal cleavage/methylation domain-containing protein
MLPKFTKLNTTCAPGFTLVEIIVATALFVVVVSALVGLYIQAIELGRSADTSRAAAQNARDLSEYLAKEIRNGTVDFGDSGAVQSPCVGSPLSPTPQGEASLALLDVTGNHLCIYLGDAGTGSGNPAYDANGEYLYVVKNSEPAQLLNSPNLAVKSFKVYLNPTSDPASGSSQEETVTILGNVQAVSGSLSSPNPKYTATIPLDVSISIPDYGYAPS